MLPEWISPIVLGHNHGYCWTGSPPSCWDITTDTAGLDLSHRVGTQSRILPEWSGSPHRVRIQSRILQDRIPLSCWDTTTDTAGLDLPIVLGHNHGYCHGLDSRTGLSPRRVGTQTRILPDRISLSCWDPTADTARLDWTARHRVETTTGTQWQHWILT